MAAVFAVDWMMHLLVRELGNAVLLLECCQEVARELLEVVRELQEAVREFLQYIIEHRAL